MLQFATTICTYLTPTILFLLLNLVIATILFTSKPSNTSSSSSNPPLARAPSLVLDRLKSFGFKSFTLHQPDLVPHTEHVTEELQHIDRSKSDTKPTAGEVQTEHVTEERHHIDRSKSDTKPTAGEVPEKLPSKMKKSATTKSAFDHFEFEEAVEKEREENAAKRRPATMRERSRVADVEVDAKCDDFINRFKQQLKLQRLDSIRRYKEMFKRGN